MSQRNNSDWNEAQDDMRQIVIILFLLGVPTWVAAADGNAILQSKCAACHTMTKLDSPGLDHIWTRQGPDLHYAGSKFRQEWLVQWLQTPSRIRPAGEFYFKHVKAGSRVDEIDESTLQPHMKLAPDEARAVAEALMKKTASADVIPKGTYRDEKTNMTMGSMFFNKLRGCASCHQSAIGVGGNSGPELYTASQRLQPDYVYAYIQDPQKVDPHVWMPNLSLSQTDIQRLTSYILQLSPAQTSKGGSQP